MNKSDQINHLATALCKAQSEMAGASKDASNPFFKSKYADLGSVIKAIKTPFANNGLSYSQFMNLCKVQGIDLNRKVLADLAMNHPEAFKAIVEKAKA